MAHVVSSERSLTCRSVAAAIELASLGRSTHTTQMFTGFWNKPRWGPSSGLTGKLGAVFHKF